MSGAKCAVCGQYISHEAISGGQAKHHFEPLSEFGPERSEWVCALCNQNARLRDPPALNSIGADRED